MFIRILAALLALSSGASASFSILFDYTYDGGFFSGSNESRRTLLEAAADVFTSRLVATTFDPIAPSDENQLTLEISNPSTNGVITLRDPVLAANTLTIYVGARDLQGRVLGLAASPGWVASGDDAWISLLQSKDSPTRFEPLGGSIAFDNATNWYFDPNPANVESFAGKLDFFSVAQHEIGHLLGFMKESEAFAANVLDGAFIGEHATALFGRPIPLSADGSHWAEGLRFEGQLLEMDPALPPNTRTNFSALGFAVLDDLGYSSQPIFGKLTVAIDDPTKGTISGNFLGTTNQEIGRQLKIRALPQPGCIFAGWTGDIVSQSNPLFFVMAKGMKLQANFIVSPFINCKGRFYGIFESSSAEWRGSWWLQANAYGAFSGTLLLNGSERPFRGVLDAQGRWQKLFRDGVDLAIEQDLQSGRIRATIVTAGEIIEFAANKLPVFTKSNPHLLTGNYTIALRANDAGSAPGVPTGSGFATARVKTLGSMRAAGRLADGTSFAFALPLNADAEVGVSIASAKNELHGVLHFTAQDTIVNIAGGIKWSRFAGPGGGSSNPGFTTALTAVGNEWSEPAPGHRVLPMMDESNGLTRVELLAVPGTLSTFVTLDERNIAIETPASAALLKLITDPGVGTFRGSFLDTNGNRVRFRGVFLQREMMGEGFFSGGKLLLLPVSNELP